MIPLNGVDKVKLITCTLSKLKVCVGGSNANFAEALQEGGKTSTPTPRPNFTVFVLAGQTMVK